MAMIMQVVGFANGAPCPIAGQYLKAFDFDAHDGRGLGDFTDDRREAKRFPSLEVAMAYWRTTSRTRPIRADGRPNRPLTASNVTFEEV
jgi:hypothetical protein